MPSPPVLTATTVSALSGVDVTAAAPLVAVTRKLRPLVSVTLAGGVHVKPWRPLVSAPMSIVSTTWPAALSTSTFTESAAPSSSKPPTPLPLSFITTCLPSTSTPRPTSEAPCSVCICRNCELNEPTVVFSFSMPLTVLICAIWLVICALSIGFSGSWFCIWVTRSLRKRSSLPASLFVDVAEVDVVPLRLFSWVAVNAAISVLLCRNATPPRAAADPAPPVRWCALQAAPDRGRSGPSPGTNSPQGLFVSGLGPLEGERRRRFGGGPFHDACGNAAARWRRAY